LLAIANVRLALDRKRAWDDTFDAIKAANSAESFSGEDGRIIIGLQTKGMNSIRSNGAPDFDVAGVFTDLAKEDYTRAVDLARGFERDAPRSSAVIAVAPFGSGRKEELVSKSPEVSNETPFLSLSGSFLPAGDSIHHRGSAGYQNALRQPAGHFSQRGGGR